LIFKFVFWDVGLSAVVMIVVIDYFVVVLVCCFFVLLTGREALVFWFCGVRLDDAMILVH